VSRSVLQHSSCTDAAVGENIGMSASARMICFVDSQQGGWRKVSDFSF